ncbi:AraC family transcriptional regulator [Marinomonas transparens]|uniref:AraC family transcriptional regulator n=1 Tax=Marinomonas transparens TaxID=2795388 RepID=A0A934N162_9GAMM|nr:AraC family transcriptional regulator [Marinomonas transparens]MBJ7536363.1 AraC family transcriptional regulator [Marinomonas transparens]
MTKTARLTRIEKVLDYIHEHLDEAIHVAELAEKSCWSRWQFQRVFGDATGLTVAQYVRELRLSKAAELLLQNESRHLDIALECGFESEISFSRAFRQMFQCSPREYRQRGKRIGLRTPLQYCTPKRSTWKIPKAFTQIRIENRPAFRIHGLSNWIYGPFSKSPNFVERVPEVWNNLEKDTKIDATKQNPIGVIDTREKVEDPEQLIYWAGYQTDPQSQRNNPIKLETLDVPEQEYAVIPVHGEVSAVETAVDWFIHHWLPESDYSSVSGFELELYSPEYDPMSSNSYMEFWLPIKPR